MHKQIEPIPNKPSVPRKRRTMLAPAAYSETMMPALRLARASRWTRKIANVLLIVLVLTVFLLAFVPWQQNVAGSGSVLAFAPDQRQQVIEAPIKGRVVRWGENIVENALVQKGQFIAEISDLDESYSARLEQQLVNSQLTADAAGRQLDANERALTAAKTIVNSYEAQVRAYEKVKEETIAAHARLDLHDVFNFVVCPTLQHIISILQNSMRCDKLHATPVYVKCCGKPIANFGHCTQI